jgi:hypothetical protein
MRCSRCKAGRIWCFRVGGWGLGLGLGVRVLPMGVYRGVAGVGSGRAKGYRLTVGLLPNGYCLTATALQAYTPASLRTIDRVSLVSLLRSRPLLCISLVELRSLI